jgi:hypothetical protein
MAENRGMGAGTLLSGAATPEDPNYSKNKAESEKALIDAARRRRDGLSKLRSFMFEKSDWALQCSSVESDEKARLQKHLDCLDKALESVDALLRVLSPVRQNDILFVADELLWNGMAIGAFMVPLHAVARSLKGFDGKRAGLAKLQKSNNDLEVLAEAARLGWELRKSSTFAHGIRKKLLECESVACIAKRKKKTNPRSEWPATRTIIRRVGAILSERQKT